MNLILSNHNWMKVLKGALISAGGAGLTYLMQFVNGSEFGALTPIVVAGMSVLVNYFRKVFGK